MTGPRPPLVVIGPTAAGKSSLAMALAAEVGHVEIVSADAMAVYRGMDVGTAKPSPAERGQVPHHVIDVADPTDDYTVSRFQADAGAAIADIEARGRSVVVVGGTGLYVRSVVDDFSVPGRYPGIVAELETEPDTAALHRRLADLDPAAAAKMLPGNRRRIVRALEVTLGSGRPFSAHGPGVDHYGPTRFLLAGLDIERDEMDRRIEARYRQQIELGFLDEVATLLDTGWSRTASQALGYKELAEHLRGELGLDEAIELAVRRTRRFARRQQRWFRRDPRITWFPALAPDLVGRVVDHWNSGATGGRELRD